MNIQKIFDALQEDDQNSALGIISGELEMQGYKVKIDDRTVSAQAFYDGELKEIENAIEPLNLSIYKENELEQVFAIEFTDFHEINIKRKEEK